MWGELVLCPHYLKPTHYIIIIIIIAGTGWRHSVGYVTRYAKDRTLIIPPPLPHYVRYPGRELFFTKRHSSSSAHYVSYPYSRMRDSSLVNMMWSSTMCTQETPNKYNNEFI